MTKRKQSSTSELDSLRARLEEAEELLRAIRAGEIDALVTSPESGARVYTLQGADRPYRILVEAMQEGAVTLSTSGLILYSNHRFADLLKRPLEQVLGAAIQSFVADSDRDTFDAQLKQSQSSTGHGEVTFVASDGTPIPTTVAFSALPLDETSAVVLVITDLTGQKRAEAEIQRLNADLEQRVIERTAQLEQEVAERKRVEADLRTQQQVLSEQRERYRVTLSSIGDAVIATDAHGIVTFMNVVAEGLTGRTQAEAVGQAIETIFHIVNETTRQPVDNPTLRVLQEGTVVGLANHTILIARDGREQPIDDSGAPIHGADGAVLGVILVFRDITERRRAEEALQVAHARTEQILESIQDGFYALDREWKFTYVNRKAEQLWNRRREDLIGQIIWEAFPRGPQTLAYQEMGRAAAEGQPIRFETHSDFLNSWVEVNVYPNPTGLSVYFRDITERKRSERYTRLLYELTSALSFAPTVEAVVQAITRQVSTVLGTNFPLIGLLTPDRRYLDLLNVPERLPDVHQQFARTRVEEPLPMTDVARTGQSLCFESRIAYLAQYPELAQVLERTGVEAVIMLPLMVNEQITGVIRIGFDQPRRIDQPELDFWTSLASSCALALERARLYEEAENARRRAEQLADRVTRLQVITARLSESLTPAEVARVLVGQGTAAMGAKTGAVYLLDDEGMTLEAAATSGYAPETMQAIQRFFLDTALPIVDAVKRGEPLWLELMDAYFARYPFASNIPGLEWGARACVPLQVDKQILGAIGLIFSQERRFTDDDKQFMEALAQQCAQALERARLYDAERQSRLEAETAKQRLRILADASALLATSLDYETTLKNLDYILLPAFADSYAIDLLGGENEPTLHRVALGAMDPARREALKELTERLAHDFKDGIMWQAIRSGQPLLTPEVTPGSYAPEDVQPDELALIRQLGVISTLCLPLIVRGKVIGTLAVAMNESERHYSSEDIPLGEELARRIAQAMDNARLYRDIQNAERQNADHAARLLVLADASRAFAEANRDLHHLYDTITERLAMLVGESCALRIVSEDEAWMDLAAVFHPDSETRALMRALGGDRRPTSLGVFGMAKETRQIIRIPVMMEAEFQESTPPHLHPYFERIGARSTMIAPLQVADRVVGFLTLSRLAPDKPYTEADEHLVQDLATRAALAIENAQLYEKAQFNAEILRQQVAEQTQELRHALERVQAADRAKTMMVSNVTHEMRTPLSSIVGFSNLLIKRTLSETKQQEFITAINREGRRLTRLIDNFLDLQRMESGRQAFSFAALDLAALVQEEISQLELDKASLPRIRVEREPVPAISADAEALRRVIRNLISNAFKFSPEGEIVITVQQHDQDVHFAIRDQGIGISRDELGHLFERFYRSQAAEHQRIQGTGMGLALCREVIEAHHGRIWAESAGEGQGATIHFTLPIASLPA